MTVSSLADRAAHSTATTGTGTITLGSALGAVAPNLCTWNSFAAAGIANGASVSYLILDSNGNWEYGHGTYTSSGTTLARTTVLASSSGTSKISLTGNNTQVFLTFLQEDYLAGPAVVGGDATYSAGNANAGDLILGSGAGLGGVRHDASINMYNTSNALRLFSHNDGSYDYLYLSRTDQDAITGANVKLGVLQGAPSLFGGNLNIKGTVPWADVTAYGAVSGGSASTNYTAFNNAITALNSAGGGILFVPAGSFATSSGLTLSTSIWLLGAGWGATELYGSVDMIVVSVPGPGVCKISDIYIHGLQYPTSSSYPCVYRSGGGSGGLVIRDAIISGGGYAFQTNGVDDVYDNVTFNLSSGNCLVYSTGAAWWIRCKLDQGSQAPSQYALQLLTGANENHFFQCDFSPLNNWLSDIAININSTSSIPYESFTNCVIGGHISISNADWVSVTQCEMGGFILVQSGFIGTVTVLGCQDVGSLFGFTINGSGSPTVIINNNRFNNTASTLTAATNSMFSISNNVFTGGSITASSLTGSPNINISNNVGVNISGISTSSPNIVVTGNTS